MHCNFLPMMATYRRNSVMVSHIKGKSTKYDIMLFKCVYIFIRLVFAIFKHNNGIFNAFKSTRLLGYNS